MFGSFRKRTVNERAFELPFVDENLVDIGGELNVTTLLRAYRSGAFPWTVHPVTWWSPDPRAIIEFSSFHASRSLLKAIRQQEFTFTLDRAFDRVIDGCAGQTAHRKSTWITPEFISGYKELHRAGYAHSLEVWQGEELAGGIYGVAIGSYFAGESMFHRVSNASKAALYFLVQHLESRGYTLFDVQMPTRVTLQMGAVLIPREQFLQRMHHAQRLAVSF
jgi:leucyl/phenylalanyl-tRNA---protein transferase